MHSFYFLLFIVLEADQGAVFFKTVLVRLKRLKIEIEYAGSGCRIFQNLVFCSASPMDAPIRVAIIMCQ